LEKIRKSVDPSRPFSSSVLEISKNPGIAFISLDASEEKLQLFHHVAVIGGSWTMEKEMLVGVLGSSSNLVPIQIMSNSIKEIKGKSFTFDQIADRLKSKNSLNHDRTAKSDFNNYNILPIPALLTQFSWNWKIPIRSVWQLLSFKRCTNSTPKKYQIIIWNFLKQMIIKAMKKILKVHWMWRALEKIKTLK
jgi:hypothetical protein